jgi:hypothetical protein
MYFGALLTGTVSGLFTATWGAYKDAPYERFSHRSFFRSLVFSVAIVTVLFATELFHARIAQLAMAQMFLLVMGIERIAIEIYKPCFRREDQSKYLIPQDCSFFGVHVANGPALIALGFALLCGTLGVLALDTTIHTFEQHMLVSVLTGLFICCGGAAKDAPFEGFQPRKFLRSAIVLACASPLLYLLGPAPLGVVIFINGGLERLIVEAYKTYFTPNPPGKFRRDLPVIDRAILAWRPVLRVVAASIVALLAALYAHALIVRP